MKSRILVVDDEAGVRFGIRDFLETNGYEVEEAESGAAAEEAFRSGRLDAAILDYLLPDIDALRLLPRLREIDRGVPILILTAHGTIDLAVRAIQEGADHFLTKPVELSALQVILERLVEQQRARRGQAARRTQKARRSIDPFVGSSKPIHELAADTRRIIDADAPVLLMGETGTGKGVLALWIHENGARREEAFVDLNCAGLTREFLESELFGHERGAFTGAAAAKEGLLEVAHRGSVFLDEVGDMDLQVQAKVLKVLEEKRFRRLGDVKDRRVDVRLIAATHQDLRRLVREGRFRSDLYFRVAAVPLTVPPLRERSEDIPVLARQLLGRIASDVGRPAPELSPRAEVTLMSYSWPGNIRELRNVLERAILFTDSVTLDPADLRFEGIAEEAAEELTVEGLTLREVERRHVERVLQAEGGRVEQAARRLGISRSALYDKMKRYHIQVPRTP